MFSKLLNIKYFYLFIVTCLLVLFVDFWQFNNVFSFKRNMIEKWGFIFFFLLPIIIIWILFLKIDRKLLRNIQSKFKLTIIQLFIIIIMVIVLYCIVFVSYILFFMGIPE
ncbi:membrane protease YdiL (CAAX protease family) [Flavobacterium sp. 7E]|nr:membrane protease YdiL (CAAX protease family) [Flavobacterium sp. 7E]